MLCAFYRVEKVNLRKLHSQAKVMGTLVTVGGAMIMTLVRGSEIGLPWTKHQNDSHASGSTGDQQSPIKGALMIGAANIGYSLFYIFQASSVLIILYFIFYPVPLIFPYQTVHDVKFFVPCWTFPDDTDMHVWSIARCSTHSSG